MPNLVGQRTMQIMDPISMNGQRDETLSPYVVVRRWTLPHGRAVAVSLPNSTAEVNPEALRRLHPEEATWATGQPPRRRVTWVGGRIALREVLAELGADVGPIFATDRGAPQLPDGLAGSVTHKAGALAVALADTHCGWQLGVDLELLHPARPHIARKILTADEQERLAALPEEMRWRETIVRFSAKEAIYKALDPFVRRYVDFDEVALELRPDGSARVEMRLSRGEGPFADLIAMRFAKGYKRFGFGRLPPLVTSRFVAPTPPKPESPQGELF